MVIEVGTAVFWHDPDNDACSGVGIVEKSSSEMVTLAMLSGSEVEALPSEVTVVNDCDVVGVDENDNLLFYNATTRTLYTDGNKPDGQDYTLDSEEWRRVDAAREALPGPVPPPKVKTDPKQVFVVSAISREGIAEDLNDYLDGVGAATDDRLAPDDARLTDEVCQTYATGLGDLDLEDQTERMIDECEDDLCDRVLRLAGIDPEEGE